MEVEWEIMGRWIYQLISKKKKKVNAQYDKYRASKASAVHEHFVLSGDPWTRRSRQGQHSDAAQHREPCQGWQWEEANASMVQPLS